MRAFARVWDTRASSPGLRCARYSRCVPYRRPSREISRCRELKNMAATDSKTSWSVVMAASKSRVHFGIALDLELLAYVRSLNPFADPVQWAVIAAKMQDITGMPFIARNVRSRTELLLSYYAAKDIVNLRKFRVRLREFLFGNCFRICAPHDCFTICLDRRAAGAKGTVHHGRPPSLFEH